MFVTDTKIAKGEFFEEIVIGIDEICWHSCYQQASDAYL